MGAINSISGYPLCKAFYFYFMHLPVHRIFAPADYQCRASIRLFSWFSLQGKY